MTARRATVAAVAVAMAIAVSGCGTSLQSLPQIGGPSGKTYTVRAEFANVLNLAKGAPVRLGATTVGSVGSIGVTGGHAQVTLHLQRSAAVPADVTAQVRFVTPLGDEYVQLTAPPAVGPAPAPGPLAPGATIPLPRTAAAASVEDTLAAAGTLLFGGGLGQVETLTSELNAILGGDQPQIRDLLANLTSAVTSLAAHDGDIDAALGALSNLSAQVNAGQAAISKALATLPAAARTITADNASVVGLLHGIDNFTPVAQGVVDQSGATLVADTNQLAPVVDQLVSVEGSLGSDLQTIATFSQRTARAAPAGYLQLHAIIDLVNRPLPIAVPPLLPALEAVLAGSPLGVIEGLIGGLLGGPGAPNPAPAAASPASGGVLGVGLP
ncbi:MCE family protein [Acidiferrimicrobium sp. IK]|uniref:MCE family protein n=1 Tax=Acidiferrimicrobium sp. IK TaxID=2871700 RepID=UPI0021CB6F4D|nr:MCE family protein [Acidiferrimicrobium sp. IK]MCU4187491.1 MCE family protein [Acidiferrimicrobium sp. IK]